VTKRLRPAEPPFTEDDALLEAALAHATIPTLMMSIVHLTGDPRLLRVDVAHHFCCYSFEPSTVGASSTARPKSSRPATVAIRRP